MGKKSQQCFLSFALITIILISGCVGQPGGKLNVDNLAEAIFIKLNGEYPVMYDKSTAYNLVGSTLIDFPEAKGAKVVKVLGWGKPETVPNVVVIMHEFDNENSSKESTNELVALITALSGELSDSKTIKNQNISVFRTGNDLYHYIWYMGNFDLILIQLDGTVHIDKISERLIDFYNTRSIDKS